jgi:hypothetical protein
MGSRCWLLVWHRHRDPWRLVELGGCRVASAGGQMVRRLICRVNRQNMSLNHGRLAPNPFGNV